MALIILFRSILFVVFGIFLCFTTVSSIMQYEMRQCIIARQTLDNKPAGVKGIYGDCACFPKQCPTTWTRQPRNVCRPDVQVIPYQEEQVRWETFKEERTLWREVQQTDFENVNVQKYRDVLAPGPPVSKPSYDPKTSYDAKPDQPINTVTREVFTDTVVRPVTKTVRRPYTDVITRRKPVKTMITKYRRVVTKYVNCCPQLKFWFLEYDQFFTKQEAYESNDVV